jgi:hypothetical protein
MTEGAEAEFPSDRPVDNAGKKRFVVLDAEQRDKSEAEEEEASADGEDKNLVAAVGHLQAGLVLVYDFVLKPGSVSDDMEGQWLGDVTLVEKLLDIGFGRGIIPRS